MPPLHKDRVLIVLAAFAFMISYPLAKLLNFNFWIVLIILEFLAIDAALMHRHWLKNRRQD